MADIKRNNRVQMGLRQATIFPIVTMDDNDVPTYGEPRNLPGSVTLSATPQGDTNTFYADDTAYYVSSSNQGYELTLEVARVPDWFLVDIMGFYITPEGSILEPSRDNSKEFALAFLVDGDQTNTPSMFFRLKPQRSETSHETKTETIEPQTETLTLIASGIGRNAITKMVAADIRDDDAAATWFDEAYLPEDSFLNDINVKSMSYDDYLKSIAGDGETETETGETE